MFDGKGLFLLLKPNGSALWRFKYVSARTADGRSKDNSISFGAYPEVPLKRAREKRDAARAQVAEGIDPSEERKKQKIAEANSFDEVAEEYIANQEHSLAKRTVDKARWQLREFVNPWIGKTPIADVKAPELFALLRRIESRGKIETPTRRKNCAAGCSSTASPPASVNVNAA